MRLQLNSSTLPGANYQEPPSWITPKFERSSLMPPKNDDLLRNCFKSRRLRRARKSTSRMRTEANSFIADDPVEAEDTLEMAFAMM